jgi:putative flippase GtrA
MDRSICPAFAYEFKGGAMKELANRLYGNVFMRYVAVSVGALAADMAVFLMLLSAGLPSVAASAIGYSVGILAHWILSSRTVFQDRVSERGTAARTQQKAMFVMSALLGLLLTMAIVGAGTAVGVDPRLAKICAIGASFLLTFLLRSVVIFRSTRNG